MNTLDTSTFLKYISPYWGKELLTPADCSNISLIITELMIDNRADLGLMKYLSRFLTQQSYDEIVEEKNIEHKCGYILCNNSPKQHIYGSDRATNYGITANQASTKFQIYNRKPSMILPNTYLSQYCCKDHYQASLFYKNQLSNEAIFIRKGIVTEQPFPADKSSNWYENGITCLEEVLIKHKELKEHGKSLADVISMMSDLSVDETSQRVDDLIKLVEDLEVVEKPGGLTGSDSEDDTELTVPEDLSRQVEGYITNNRSFGGYVV
ncbi:Piso0_002338 [Millerozyma farinosa CBS 7064]|uniref:RNA polymerase II subunit B1 CTD phosphatase RPAP2 homolog n=1 Tax=Pichia sorbitophila (strain ATCC MYA-4447 / BCRC 22081 / CBS 7064 / NBRC 10061 / NRRL Y-12695) TaxID=559304 RepID=G8YCC5_PICSO|nr:Piso0_002338 [Millerozyma farinosa CBS 7064]